VLAGTVPVTGPGLRITVQSSSGEVGTDQLLNGLEELRNAGAEAIEINDDVRVVAQTGISDAAGTGLFVDGVRVSPPYVVDVIGNPETMATALGLTFTEDVKAVGGTVDVRKPDEVEIASTHQVTPMRFAAPEDQE
jgi:uncharacterized protein YlxW (UPF0749 family)